MQGVDGGSGMSRVVSAELLWALGAHPPFKPSIQPHPRPPLLAPHHARLMLADWSRGGCMWRSSDQKGRVFRSSSCVHGGVCVA